MQIARDLLIHLRLHFQLLLAPIFLWGFTTSDARVDLSFWLGFVAFHLCLYGGTTAFNSYYDRDEGPVGGLENPPPAHEALLPFSLVLQGIGALIAAFVNRPFLLIYLVIFVMGAAYSHPLTRWKARPFGGLLTVGIGQGVLAGLAGWIAGQSGWSMPPWIDWGGILAISLVTVGFYPLTQIYQIEEDAARGDITYAVWAGPNGVFALSIPVLAVSIPLLLWTVWRKSIDGASLQWWLLLLVGLLYVGLLSALIAWWLTFSADAVRVNFRRIMRLYWLTSGGFLLFLVINLILRS